MTGIRFLLPLILLPVLGTPITRVSGSDRLDFASRATASAAAAFVAICVEMFVLSWLGIRWSLLTIGLPLLIGFLLLNLFLPRSMKRPVHISRSALPALAAASVCLLMVLYAAATARATSSDLLLFWGPKGERFALERQIDIDFLTAPGRKPMHPDYPPLVPLLYALSTMAAGRFAWGASLLWFPFFLLLTAASFFGLSRRSLGDRRAAEFTAVLASLLGYTMTIALTAGNAEAPLLFFEASALSALVFGDRTPARDAIASVSLGGAVLTKFEGVTFALVMVCCAVSLMAPPRRPIRTLLTLGAFPLSCQLAWLVYCAQHGLGQFAGAQLPVLRYADVVVLEMLRWASYEAWYLPWIVVAALWITGRARRSWRLPTLVGIGCLIVNAFYYLQGGFTSPAQFIAWSANRTLLTPLICFFIAAASSHVRAPAARSPGVVAA